jgi:hypothetical protein
LEIPSALRGARIRAILARVPVLSPSKELSQCSIPSITSGRLAVTARFHARSWVALASNALCVKRQGKPEVSGESVGHVESDRLVAPDESHDGGAGYAGFPL